MLRELNATELKMVSGGNGDGYPIDTRSYVDVGITADGRYLISNNFGASVGGIGMEFGSTNEDADSAFIVYRISGYDTNGNGLPGSQLDWEELETMADFFDDRNNNCWLNCTSGSDVDAIMNDVANDPNITQR